jgi:hypothetical protein
MSVQQRLIEKFGDKINQMSCVYIADGENSLRHFLNGKKFKTIIEIGTYQGVSTAILSEYAEKVHALDIADLPLRKDIFSYLGINNVEFHHVDPDINGKEMLMNEIFEKEQVDFVFIDGDHWGKSLEEDFRISSKCDKILIHDYEPTFPVVFDFCNNLKGYKTESKNLFFYAEKEKTTKKKVTKKKAVKKENV